MSILDKYLEFTKGDIKFYIRKILSQSLRKKELFPNSQDKKRKKAIVFATPQHGNLGDHAIAYAQKKYIENNLPDYEYIEIPITETFKYLQSIKKNMQVNDIVFIHGGGNMGTLYPNNERVRREIIKTFTDNKIIQFPQSTKYEDGAFGIRELKKSSKIFNRNKKLNLIAREHVTYEFMKKYFLDIKVLQTPDIVFTIDEVSNYKRSGILTCFRDDKEKNVSEEFTTRIIENLESMYLNVKQSDTHLGNKLIKIDERSKYLLKIWSEFQKSEVVLTDRLHGMIFAFITSTPCIVFENSNPKVKASYNKWLEKCNFIQLIDKKETVSDIIGIVDKLLHISPERIDLTTHFEPLEKLLKDLSSEQI